MSANILAIEAAYAEQALGDASFNAANFYEAIGHYAVAMDIHPGVSHENDEATNGWGMKEYHCAIAALKNGVGHEEKTKIPAAVAKITDEDRELGDRIAMTVLEKFKRLPKKRKPLEGGGKKEWVPLAGIVAQTGDEFRCISLGTGMKCLPFHKLEAVEGKVLHDWHAEVVALRSLNVFFLEEINKIRGEGRFLHAPQKSEFLRQLTWEERKDTVGRWHRDTPDYKYTIREGIKLHMYCSEAPCGDASMELIMLSQEDATAWEVAADAAHGALPGRSGFGQLGIVRRKPSRPDAPECRSKSCSDKLAQKQVTSVLNSITALAISPANAYLETFTVPESEYVHRAWVRCFGASGRLAHIKDFSGPLSSPKGGYRFQPFKALTTRREFEYSRRSLTPDGTAPKGSNIACSWSPHHEETIIGGILQGCKLTSPPKDEAASVLSRYKMWQAFEADKRTPGADNEDDTLAADYWGIKSKRRLRARGLAKVATRLVMMKQKSWVQNTDDDRWSRESEQSLAKKMRKLSVESGSEDSDSISEQASNATMAKDRFHISFPGRKRRNGEEEFKFSWLSPKALALKYPGSSTDHFDDEWMSMEELKKDDKGGRVVARFRAEEAEFQKEVASRANKEGACEGRHAEHEEVGGFSPGEWRVLT